MPTNGSRPEQREARSTSGILSVAGAGFEPATSGLSAKTGVWGGQRVRGYPADGLFMRDLGFCHPFGVGLFAHVRRGSFDMRSTGSLRRVDRQLADSDPGRRDAGHGAPGQRLGKHRQVRNQQVGLLCRTQVIGGAQ